MDKYQIIAIIAFILLTLLIIVLSSRGRIVKTYNKYMRIDNHHNITGKQLAFFAKQHLELKDLDFALTKHKLGDAYNYKTKTLILSEDVCNTASLASLTIVAHELGHALQHEENSPLFSVTVIVNKLTRLTSRFILPFLIFGLFFCVFKYPTLDFGYTLIIISGCLFLLQILSKLLNIPLEYNASRRGLKFLKTNNFLSTSEFFKAKKLLGIAAQTYIASLLDELFIFTKNKKQKRKKR